MSRSASGVMQVATQAVDWLVFVGGLGTWLLFVPQIRKLNQVQDSRSYSFEAMYGSLALQLAILAQAVLHENWYLTFTMATSVVGLAWTIVLIHRYRPRSGNQQHAAD